MSTGRRLAKRSIIGTKVCAPGPDGLWYSGVIQDVKTPPTSTITSSLASYQNDIDDGSSINSNTKYIVRFDFKTMQNPSESSYHHNHQNSVIMQARRVAHLQYSNPAQALRRNAMIKEFREGELVGPGFRSILGIQLQPGQRVFLTFNGRETSGDVIQHDLDKDEVIVKILAMGNEEPIELKKRLEEVRLLESRRSARLADQDRDTDFARLADMGGDRRRTHSIEVPMPMTPQNNPRKRPPSYSNDCSEDQCNKVEMDECNAALILMNLSNSPKSPRNGDVWHVSSPYSSSASWSSGSSSPPLSDDGIAIMHTNALMLQDASASARIRTISVSTSDEGIDVDFKEDVPRKKRANKSRFKCTYRGCNYTESMQTKIERHIRHVHLGNKKPRRSVEESDHEEEFYYTEVEDDDDDIKPSPTSPTLSHRDMARPPHEDPEYQRQIVGNFKNGRITSQQQPHNNNNAVNRSMQNAGQQYNQLQGHQQHQQQQQQQLQNNNNNNTICMAASNLAHHNYTWSTSSILNNNNNNNNSNNNNNNNNSNRNGNINTTPQKQHNNTLIQAQATHQHHNGSGTATLIKRVHSSPRPSQTVVAPYPAPSPPAYVQNQLSQSNVTVTVTTSPNQHHQQQQQHHPNGSHQINQHHQQQQQQQQQHQLSTGAMTITTTTSNAVNNNNNSYQTHQPIQQQHHNMHHSIQQQQQQQQQQSPNANISMLNGNNAQASSLIQQHHHQQQHQQHHPHTAAINNTTRHQPNNGGAANTTSPPNRRTRGENKKCRKVYGMLRREQWCTQCKWKKACSRFGD